MPPSINFNGNFKIPIVNSNLPLKVNLETAYPKHQLDAMYSQYQRYLNQSKTVTKAIRAII